MNFDVRFEGIVRTLDDQKVPEEGFNAFLDEVLKHLSAAHEVKHSRYSASASAGTVHLSVELEADTTADALESGSAAIRSAIHAARGHTPGWSIDWCNVTLSGGNVLELEPA